MTASQLKLQLQKEIDSLNPSSIKEFYGLITNYLNGKKSIDEWATLSTAEKKAIDEGLAQLDSGQKISRVEAMNSLRKRFR